MGSSKSAWIGSICLGRLALTAVLLGLACFAPAIAQEEMVQIGGQVQDMEGDPIVGARVVYRLVDSEGVFISQPTDGGGRYTLDLPAGSRCRPVAVITADGTRVELGNVAPARTAEGMSQQITIDQPRRWNPSAVVQNFTDSDRLFQSFIEDTSIPERYRLESQARRQEGDSIDRGLLMLIGAAQFEAIPEVEFGARLSFVGVNSSFGAGGDGIGDLDLWVKYALGATSDSRHEIAFGAVATLPTGDDDAGAGYDSTRSKLFVAGRREISWGVMTANVGLAFNGDGRLFGSVLDGRTALSVNVGTIVPWTYRMAFVAEAGYEGERFDGFGSAASISGGVNVLLKEGSIRGGLGLGLADGAPDVEVIVGYAFHF